MKMIIKLDQLITGGHDKETIYEQESSDKEVETNYNELELCLIELTGCRKNIYKQRLSFRMIDGN